MSLPWVPIQTNQLRAELKRMRWSKDNPAPLFIAWAELLVMAADGELDQWSERQLADRWGWSRGKVRRNLSKCWTDHKRTTDGPAADQLRTTIRQRFSWVEPTDEPAADQRRTSGGPTRASSLQKIEEEEEEEDPLSAEADRAEAEQPKAPKKPSRTTQAKQVYAYWHQWHPLAAKTPDTGHLSLIRGRLSDGYEPEDLELVARWVHEGPDAAFWRGENDRGRKYTGVGTIFKRDKWGDRLETARRWHAAGEPKDDPSVSVTRKQPGRADRLVFLPEDDDGAVVQFPGGSR